MNILLIIMMLQSFNMNKIEDRNSLYLMDKDISYYQYDWVRNYISHNYGIRTTQGCLDVERWHQEYDGKFKLPVVKIFDIDYFFYKREGYNWHIETHELNFNYYKNFMKFTLLISPNYLKMNDYGGIGFGFYKNKNMNIQLFLNLKDFDHNYATNRLYGDTFHDPYIEYPFQLELKGNFVSKRGYLNFNIKNTHRSTKEILYKDSLLGFHNEKSYKGRVFTAFTPMNSFTVSGYSNWDYYNSQIDSFNYHYENTIQTAFLSVSLDYSSKIGKFHISLPFYYKYNLFYDFPDSTNYSKKMYGLTVEYFNNIFKYTTLGFGYQRGIRERIIEDSLYTGGGGDLENRLVVSLEFNFARKTYLKVIEGLELDNFPHIPINRIHNHTYVLIQYTH